MKGEAAAAEVLAGRSEELRQAVDEWLVYKQEKRQSYTPTGLKTFLNKVLRHAESYGDGPVSEAIRDAMSNSYQGVVWEKLGKGRPQAPKGKADDMQGKYNMMQRWANG